MGPPHCASQPVSQLGTHYCQPRVQLCLRAAHRTLDPHLQAAHKQRPLPTHLSKMRRSLPSCTFLSTAIVLRNCSTVMVCSQEQGGQEGRVGQGRAG